jgi:electron transfer flavoprotein beta subunit
MQAKRKPLAVKTLADFSVDVKTLPRTVETLTITPPKPRVAGVKVNTVAELIEKLKFEAKVL